jgi:hypothetical protein
MPMTAEETRKAVSDVRATLRRIADALDEIAGTLAAMWNSTKEEGGDLCHEK